LTNPISYDIMFIRFEELFDQAHNFIRYVCERTGRLHDYDKMVESFPKKRERHSKPNFCVQDTLYASLQSRLDSLPPCFIRRAGEGSISPLNADG
ncbi:hypothetical protein CYMTET_34367, partial [Cymbomonas tetramitiformis]